MRHLGILASLLVLSLPAVAQVPPPSPGWRMTWGFDETLDAGPLGGGTGPEDVAYNPTTDSLFVTHDIPGSTPDILLEYSVDGKLLNATTLVPGIGGLCFYPPTGNLLATSGNLVFEVDVTTGGLAAGGVNVTIAPYGNIQDLDWDRSTAGVFWIHDGNSGDVSTITLPPGTTGTLAPLSVFVLTNPGIGGGTGPFGSQAMSFRGDNGNLAFAVAFFANDGGTLATGAYVETDLAGTLVAYGAAAASALFRTNVDTCGVAPQSATTVNGMTWIDPTAELALSSFFVNAAPPASEGANVIRYAPSNTAYVARLGDDGLRGDGLRFALGSTGDAVIGTSGFTLDVANVDMGTTVTWAVSTARDCADIPFVTSVVYLGITGGNLIITAPFNVGASTSLSLPLDLSGLSPAVAGLQLWTQFVGTDLSAGGLPILSACARLRLDTQ